MHIVLSHQTMRRRTPPEATLSLALVEFGLVRVLVATGQLGGPAGGALEVVQRSGPGVLIAEPGPTEHVRSSASGRASHTQGATVDPGGSVGCVYVFLLGPFPSTVPKLGTVGKPRKKRSVPSMSRPRSDFTFE